MPSEPDLGRVLGDLEMDDSSSMVIKDDHGIQQLKRVFVPFSSLFRTLHVSVPPIATIGPLELQMLRGSCL